MKGLQRIAKALSDLDRKAKDLPANTPDRFVALCGTENSRGQGVGAIVDSERFEVTETREIESVREVFGIQDLRAAFVVRGKDKNTGQKMRYVIEHLKSMRGGPDATAKVRTKQVQLTIADLGEGQPCGVSGIEASDWLQVIEAQNFNFWRNKLLGRDLSDHGLNRYVLNVTKTPDPEEEITIIIGDMNSKLDSATDVTDVLEKAGYFLAGAAGLVPTQIAGPSVLDGFFNDRRDGPYTSVIEEVDCT